MFYTSVRPLLALATSIAILTAASPAYSQDQARTFDIPPQPLKSAASADATRSTDTPSVDNSVVVVAHRDEGETSYNVATTTTSDRFGGTLRDTPQSTAVITAKVIQDQQVQSINEAIQNVGVASVNVNNTQGPSSFEVRGFPVTPLTNGMQAPSAILQPVANIERIEVLQGPSAILAGSFSEGGTVNIVTKKPTSDPLLDITGELGSYGERKITLDASDALTSNKALSGRLILEAEGADDDSGGYIRPNEYLVAPTLRYKNRSVDATVGFTWTSSFQAMNSYTFLDPHTGNPIIRGNGPIGPARQGLQADNPRVFYDVTANLTSWLTFSSRASVEHFNLTTDSFSAYGFDPIAGSPYIFGIQTASRQAATDSTEDSYFRAKWSCGDFTSTSVVGGNFIRQRTATSYANQSNFYASPEVGGNLPPINFFDTSGQYPTPAYTYYESFVLTTSEYGIYIQQLLEYKAFHLVLGGRSNHLDDQAQFTRPRRPDGDQTASQFTPTAGAVYDLTPDVSLYANFMKGFIPNFGTTSAGALIPNNYTSNKEIGAKADFLAKRLSVDVSLYDLKQSNLAVTDPTNRAYLISIPGEEAKGVQAELTGQILPGLNLISSFSYAHFSELDPRPFATNVPAEPDTRYSLYASYRQQAGLFKGAGIALGVFGESRSFAANYASFRSPSGVAYTPTIPGGGQVNMNLFYDIGHVHLTFGVKNLLNSRLYGTSFESTYVPVAAFRNTVGTISYHFF